MKPYTNPYVHPLHVDDPERDPLSVPADHLSPDSTVSHRPAARLTVNKTTRPEAFFWSRGSIHAVWEYLEKQDALSAGPDFLGAVGILHATTHERVI